MSEWSHETQQEWEQLCDYLKLCVESSGTISADYRPDEGTPSWCVWDREHPSRLLSQNRDASIEVPRDLLQKMQKPTGASRLLYGYPTVASWENSRIKIAPVCYVEMEIRQANNNPDKGSVLLIPTTRTVFNHGLLLAPWSAVDQEEAAELLREIEQRSDEGDYQAYLGAVVSALGRGSSELNPRSLQSYVSRDARFAQNTAIFLYAGADFTVNLLKELAELRFRRDWADTAAAPLIFGTPPPPLANQKEPYFAAPLRSNAAQEKALQKLRTQELTVVTGPPGTGKTQLVVNAVANVWLDQETALVTSTNNAAVDMPTQKAASEIARGTLIRTGNRKTRAELHSLVAAAVHQADQHSDDQMTTRERLARAYVDLQNYQAQSLQTQDQDARLLSSVHTLLEAKAVLPGRIQAVWGPLSPPPNLNVDGRLVYAVSKACRSRQPLRWLRARKLRKELLCQKATLDDIRNYVFPASSLLQLEKDFQQDKLHRFDHAPVHSHRSSIHEWTTASLDAIVALVTGGIREGQAHLGDFDTGGKGGAKQKAAFRASVPFLRCWASTAFSLELNFPLEAGLFDLVIVDEASQCNLADVLPAAYRAKRLGVVGDPQQLPPIRSLSDEAHTRILQRSGVDHNSYTKRRLCCTTSSAFDAFSYVVPKADLVTLNEHYRCRPEIAKWFNKVFYGGKLIVLTAVTEIDADDRILQWIDVNGSATRPPSGRSWRNEAEADQAVNMIRFWIKREDTTVGVVTPYKAQAELIETMAEEALGREALGEVSFDCGTAHTFQGNEKDVMIFSSVVAQDMPSRAAKWVENEKRLINVAVSRAKHHLIVVGHPNLLELENPTLGSLRQYVKSGDHPEIGHRADSVSESSLLHAMQQAGVKALHHVTVEGYELDFAVREQGIKLNIEVDGEQHSALPSYRQDKARDALLFSLGWAVLRFPAWQCLKEPTSAVSAIQREIVLLKKMAEGTRLSTRTGS